MVQCEAQGSGCKSSQNHGHKILFGNTCSRRSINISIEICLYIYIYIDTHCFHLGP